MFETCNSVQFRILCQDSRCFGRRHAKGTVEWSLRRPSTGSITVWAGGDRGPEEELYSLSKLDGLRLRVESQIV